MQITCPSDLRRPLKFSDEVGNASEQQQRLPTICMQSGVPAGKNRSRCDSDASCSTMAFSVNPSLAMTSVASVCSMSGMCDISEENNIMAPRNVSTAFETPPLTPRVSRPQKTAFETPPSTPRVLRPQKSPSPPPGFRRKEDTPLMQAMRRSDEQLVWRAFEVNPDAAKEPFLDHACEQPLCFACRVLCSETIVQILLEHGAYVSALDVQGLTPLAVLSATSSSALQRSREWTPFHVTDLSNNSGQERERRSIAIAKLLLKAGADPSSAQGAGKKGGTCMKLARDHDNTHLIHLFKAFTHMKDTQPTCNH